MPADCFAVDNRNCAHERSLQKFLTSNGKHEISRQTRPPEIETYASQSQRCNTFAVDAKSSALYGSRQLGSNSLAALGNR
jgi:hypothetical protein